MKIVGAPAGSPSSIPPTVPSAAHRGRAFGAARPHPLSTPHGLGVSVFRPESALDDARDEFDILTRRVREHVESVLSVPRAAGNAARGRPVIDEFSLRIEHVLDDRVPLPVRVGRFELTGPMGVGGMGVVMEGRHEVTGQRVAVKLALRSKVRLAEALRSEAKALGKVDALNVVRVLDAGETDDYVWMATPFVEGRGLDVILREGTAPASEHFSFHSDAGGSPDGGGASKGRRTPERRLLDGDGVLRYVTWFRDLARTLHQLHEQGLVHRDVKPANIIINSEDRPVLIDFGLAQDVGQACEELAGTIPYMSPEQTLTAWGVLEAPTDVYSLAITFHEALTGRRAVTGRGYDAIRAIAFERVPPPSSVSGGVPGSLDRIFARALEKSPDARYSSAAELADDLDSWLRARGRRSVRTALVAILVLLAVTAVGLAVGHLRAEVVHQELRAAIDGRDYDRAIALVIEHRDDRAGDAAFADLRDRAIAAVGPARTTQLLFSQSLSIDLDEDGGEPIELSLREKYAEEARKLLGDRGDPDLLLHVVFADLMANRPEDAHRVLGEHASLLEDSSLLRLVAALVEAALGDFDVARRRFRSAERDPRLHPDLVLSLKALLLLWRAPGRRLGKAEEIRELERDVSMRFARMASAYGPVEFRGNRLLLATRSRLRFELGMHRDALRDYAVLLEEPLDDSERYGVLCFSAASHLLLSRAEDDDHMADAVRHTATVVRRQDAAVDWISARALREKIDWRLAFAWLEAVAGAVGGRLPGGVNLLSLIDLTTTKGIYTLPAARVARLAAAAPVDPATAAPEEVRRRTRVCRNGLWAFHYAVGAAAETEGAGEVRRLREEADRFLERVAAIDWRGVDDGLPAVAAVVDGLNEATESRLTHAEGASDALEGLRQVRAAAVAAGLDADVIGLIDEEIERFMGNDD